MNYVFRLIRLIFKLISKLLTRKKHCRKSNSSNFENNKYYRRYQQKPKWVENKVLYLKAHLPNYGCRKIAHTFNKIYVDKNISVSKSYVYLLIKKHNYEINQIRKKFKHKKPKKLPNNLIWHIDLTKVEQHQVFGVIDSGSRALLLLRNIKDKSTITLLELLLKIIKQCGKPKIIKSDNEAVFVSKFFKFAFWALGIKHRTTQIASPWQNGKIERLFKTMKESFISLNLTSKISLNFALEEFRFFYNHIRPHQHLNYGTPAEVWNNKMRIRFTKKYYYRGLDRNIAGYYFME